MCEGSGHGGVCVCKHPDTHRDPCPCITTIHLQHVPQGQSLQVCVCLCVCICVCHMYPRWLVPCCGTARVSHRSVHTHTSHICLEGRTQQRPGEFIVRYSVLKHAHPHTRISAPYGQHTHGLTGQHMAKAPRTHRHRHVRARARTIERIETRSSEFMPWY